MKFKYIAFVISFSLARAQSGPANAVYARLVTDSQIAASPAIYLQVPVIYNIGQSYHQASLQLADAPMHTCNPSASRMGLNIYGSYVQTSTVTNYIQIPGIPFENSINTALYTQAVGTFPFIYVRVLVSDITNCTYTVNYSGSLFSTNTSNLSQASSAWTTAAIVNGTTTINTGSATTAGLFWDLFQVSIASSANQTVTITCGGNNILQFNVLANTTTPLIPPSNPSGSNNSLLMSCAETNMSNVTVVGTATGQLLFYATSNHN